MNANDYQEAAVRTSAEFNLAVLALGVAGEAGEVADYIKKVVGHGHRLDAKELSAELGDILWYVAVLTHFLGYKLGDVMEDNINKLIERYPEGFSSERSINR